MFESKHFEGEFVDGDPFMDSLVDFCHVLSIDHGLLKVMGLHFGFAQFLEHDFESSPDVPVVEVAGEQGEQQDEQVETSDNNYVVGLGLVDIDIVRHGIVNRELELDSDLKALLKVINHLVIIFLVKTFRLDCNVFDNYFKPVHLD